LHRYHRQQQSVIAVARRSFRPLQSLAPDAGDLTLLASIPGYPDTSEVELTRDVWPAVSSIVHSVTIAVESGASVTSGQQSVVSSWLTSPVPVFLPQKCYRRTPSQSAALQSSLSTLTTTRDQHHLMYKPLSGQLGHSPPFFRDGGRRFESPPSRLPDVTVELLLAPSWSFSAIYPLPQTAITPSEKQHIAGQSLTWTVEAEPDGRLVDKTSGTEVSYLYWEATYVMLFCVARPTAINLFFPSDIWLFQREFPSRYARRLSRNNPCRGHRDV
jgi:hypothetical protein